MQEGRHVHFYSIIYLLALRKHMMPLLLSGRPYLLWGIQAGWGLVASFKIIIIE